ncbi:type II secretion system F family protein [Ornithinimicrobium sp. Y1847]|uniref:type II secretion system F family protein n=1 Tax=unclassified Ornithinimicrobium TaxID=2615080 RepID=UPI003B67ED05
MALALAGGCSLGAAARLVADQLPVDYGEELAAVAHALTRGEDPGQAWAAAGPRWSVARRCLDLAARAGVAPGEALVRAAQDLRRDAVAEVEVAAARLGVRLVLPLGLGYLPAFVLITIVPVVLALTQDLAW